MMYCSVCWLMANVWNAAMVISAMASLSGGISGLMMMERSWLALRNG